MNRTLILITIILACTLVFVFKQMYLPTRDKLLLTERKIASYEQQIEAYRHAEIQTAQTINKLKEKISQDKEALDWSNQPVPAAVLGVLQDTHQTATIRYTPGNRMPQNNKN